MTVRASKGDEDRVTLVPKPLAPDLKPQLEKVKALHDRDVAGGAGEAPLPSALGGKYPNAGGCGMTRARNPPDLAGGAGAGTAAATRPPPG